MLPNTNGPWSIARTRPSTQSGSFSTSYGSRASPRFAAGVHSSSNVRTPPAGILIPADHATAFNRNRRYGTRSRFFVKCPPLKPTARCAGPPAFTARSKAHATVCGRGRPPSPGSGADSSGVQPARSSGKRRAW